jgi:hypothetical protein
MKLVKKPATKAREGVSPFTGEKMIFKAKPASKKVRIPAGEGAERRGELRRCTGAAGRPCVRCVRPGPDRDRVRHRSANALVPSQELRGIRQ